MNKALLYIVGLCLLSISACVKEPEEGIITGEKGVYISNEGGFNFGAGEVSFYDPAKQEVSNGLFQKANHYMLGDVAQSMFVKDSTGFIVVNNSQKVEVVRLPSMQRLRTITIAGSSPRYFMPVNDSIAYVTELYAAKIHVVNYQTGTVVKAITTLSRWTEHLLNFGDYVMVEERNLDAYPSSTTSLVKISTANHSFVQRYTFNGTNPNGMVKDKNGRIWLAVAQDSAHSVVPALHCLNADLSINKTIEFPMGHHLSCLSIDGAGDKLYFLDNGLQRMDITDTQAPAAAFIPANSRNFYALGIHPVSGDIYISDALDYIQPSRIYRYQADGTLVQSFAAGVISGNFTFRYE